MADENNKVRLKRERSFHGNQYQVVNERNGIKFSNVSSGINQGCYRQVESEKKEH